MEQNPEHFFGEVEAAVIPNEHTNPERLGARLHDCDRLRMTFRRNKKRTGTMRVSARGCGCAAERHRLGGGGGFVQHRGIRDIETGQVRHHRLKIKQRLEPTLRNLRLIGGVSCIPTRIFQDVPLNHGRGDRIGIASADERPHDFVLQRNSSKFCQCVAFAKWFGQIQWLFDPDARRHGPVNQRIDAFETNCFEHLRNRAGIRSDVPAREGIEAIVERRFRLFWRASVSRFLEQIVSSLGFGN